MQLGATVLGAKDPLALAGFYRDLLGWEITDQSPDWIELPAPGGGAGLSFQTEENHVPPVWPTTEADQQMMMHLDIAVQDLEQGAAAAQALGASLAPWQPQDDVRVMIDPAGHPFCLYEPGHEG
jgi:catechol 2,3-dioxygenase-like lactoylglutathione lyase family enzyme